MDPSFAVLRLYAGEYATHAYFVVSMFLRFVPDVENECDKHWITLNAPCFHSNPERDGTPGEQIVAVEFRHKITFFCCTPSCPVLNTLPIAVSCTGQLVAQHVDVLVFGSSAHKCMALRSGVADVREFLQVCLGAPHLVHLSHEPQQSRALMGHVGTTTTATPTLSDGRGTDRQKRWQL